MTNTLHSIYEYDYTGQVDFAAPSHQQASDIVVLVNDVVKSQASDYTLAGRVVTFTGFTPSNGDKIIVRRETASAARQVNFVSGSMLKADTLDQDSDQIFNIAQEALDKAVMIGGDYNARYYGATLVAPTTPTPSDGDLWFDTSANVMKVYNASASSWSSLTLTAEDQASIDTVAGITSEVQTVAANVTGINHYGRTFLGSSANAPSAYPDGTALVIGALWFDSSVNIMKVYQANGWHNIATAVVNPINRKSFVASAGQTAFSMAYEAGHVDVFLNGVKLVESTATVNNDFVATSGTSVVLNTGAAAGDTIEIVADTISPLTNVVTGDAGTDASYNSLTGVITVPRGDTGATGASVTTANVTAAGAAMLTGADFTGDISFGDGLNINIGTGDDLKLYHLSDNNASYIHNAGVGGLVTRTNKLYIKSENNSKQMLSAFENAHVGLYHDGDLKFKTTSTGIDVHGNIAVSSGATFTGDITAESKLIAKKIPVASDLLTTSRSIQDLAAWSTYGGIGSNYALTPEKYRDALDVNQDKRFSSADASGINSFVAANYSSTEHDTYISLVGNQSNITSTFIQDVLDGDYDIDCVVIDKDASSIVTVSGDIAVSGTVDGRDILADGGKLDLIEASADVTDATNVASAGALMDSEVTNLAQVKAFDSSDYATAAQGTTADNALPKAGGQMTGNITFSGTQTVDGRDLSTDGSKLDTLLYHRVSELRLAGNTSAGNYLYLSTSDQNLGQTTNIYHPSTPDDTTRLVDVEWTTYWGYTSAQNDTRLTLQLIVPVGATTQNLGTVTEVSQYDPNYNARGSGQKWYYVSGDVTHHFTPFGRMSQSSSGSLEHTVVSSQYDPNTNRTYFCLKISTANMTTGNTAYWHPYAWESTYTTLTQSYDITERYRSGLDRNKVSFKLPFTDATLTFRLKIKELASGDNAQVADSVVRLTSMGV